jgi:hypothetical protein
MQADADQARMRAESNAKARAEVEAALLKSRQKQADLERVAKEAGTKSEKSTSSVSKPSKPFGAIQLAKLEQGALRDGEYGIRLGGWAEIENLGGAKIEIAAYFSIMRENRSRTRTESIDPRRVRSMWALNRSFRRTPFR